MEDQKPKLSLLDAADVVLSESGQPLSAKAIVRLAEDKGIWQSGSGKTPANTLYTSITKEIKAKGSRSRFKRDKSIKGAFISARQPNEPQR